MDFEYVTQVSVATRLETIDKVEKFHSALKSSSQFELKKFEYSKKEIKVKGEVIEEYQLVKATLVFNNEKEPEAHISIEFGKDEGSFPAVVTTTTFDYDIDETEDEE